jgi:microsomal epoxide hydrolase
MANEYGNLPNAASSDIKPFTAKADEEQLSELKTLIKLGKLPSPTYESLHEDRRYGVTSKWMAETKEYWLNSFNW